MTAYFSCVTRESCVIFSCLWLHSALAHLSFRDLISYAANHATGWAIAGRWYQWNWI